MCAHAFVSRFVYCLFLASVVPVAAPAAAQSGGVRLGIRISADTPEALQAWRRAIGLEAPDPAADAKWRNQAARQPGADAARERRRRRTLELIPRDGVATGIGEAECLPLPAVSDPCTRVVSYDPQARIISVTER